MLTPEFWPWRISLRRSFSKLTFSERPSAWYISKASAIWASFEVKRPTEPCSTVLLVSLCMLASPDHDVPDPDVRAAVAYRQGHLAALAAAARAVLHVEVTRDARDVLQRVEHV